MGKKYKRVAENTLVKPSTEAATPDSRGCRARICFSLLFAEQLLNGEGGSFGGAEVRGVTFLNALAATNEFDLHVVFRGVPRAAITRADGITVHYRPEVSYFEGHQDSSSNSVWASVDADLYIAFGANEATSELARFCHAHGSALVVSIASDGAFDPFVYEGSNENDPYGVPGRYIWYGMQHATQLIVQTERQAQLLRERVHREATLIRNPAPIGTRTEARSAPKFGGRILWVGRVDPNKRPEEAFAMVSALPHRQFIVVCNNIRTLGANKIEELQLKLPNLMLADQVDLRDIDALFQFSDILLNTSVTEGFPNTFLQAGMHGVPIVSMLVDPDHMMSKHGCGVVSDGSRDDLAVQIETLLSSNALYANASAANARWVRQRHDAAERTAELAAVIRRMLNEPSSEESHLKPHNSRNLHAERIAAHVA